MTADVEVTLERGGVCGLERRPTEQLVELGVGPVPVGEREQDPPSRVGPADRRRRA